VPHGSAGGGQGGQRVGAAGRDVLLQELRRSAAGDGAVAQPVSFVIHVDD